MPVSDVKEDDGAYIVSEGICADLINPCVLRGSFRATVTQGLHHAPFLQIRV